MLARNDVQLFQQILRHVVHAAGSRYHHRVKQHLIVVGPFFHVMFMASMSGDEGVDVALRQAQEHEHLPP